MFGRLRLAYLEADVASIKDSFFRHLDDCNQDRKESQQRYLVLSDKIDVKTDLLEEKIDHNAKACIEKAEAVGDKVDHLAWEILWKVFVGLIVVCGALVAALLRFHPTLSG